MPEVNSFCFYAQRKWGAASDLISAPVTLKWQLLLKRAGQGKQYSDPPLLETYPWCRSLCHEARNEEEENQRLQKVFLHCNGWKRKHNIICDTQASAGMHVKKRVRVYHCVVQKCVERPKNKEKFPWVVPTASFNCYIQEPGKYTWHQKKKNNQTNP